MKRSDFVVSLSLLFSPHVLLGQARAKKGVTVYATTYSHIDPAWRWPLQEGLQAADVTFRSVLRVLSLHPEVTFSETSASLYEWIERTDQKTFQEVRRAVRRGQWIPLGGWWTEADTNIPSGEALMRQGVYGQQYFHRAFGASSKSSLLGDSFGSSLNLPAILKAQGLENYAFGRGTFADSAMPVGVFGWVAPSGDTVKAYRGQIAEQFDDMVGAVRAAGELDNDSFLALGLGDHGGGPGLAALAKLNAFLKSSAAPRFVMTTMDRFFNMAAPKQSVGGEIEGVFPGAFSNNSWLKQSNFQAERALIDAERYDAMAYLAAARLTAPLDLNEDWKSLLLNQHHDAISATSIRSSVDSTIEQNRAVVANAESASVGLLESIADTLNFPLGSAEQCYVCFNPLPSEVAAPILYPMTLYGPLASDDDVQKWNQLLDARGQEIPFQLAHADRKESATGEDLIARVKIPSFGYTTIRTRLSNGARSPQNPFQVSGDDFSNGLISFRFDQTTGQPNSIVDLRTGAQQLAQSARLVVHRDLSDTWGSQGVSVAQTEEIGSLTVSNISVVERGPVRQVVRVTLAFGDSTASQDWILYAGERMLRSMITINWNRTRSRLSFSLPVNATERTASYDVPFARVSRAFDEQVHPAQSSVSVRTATANIAIVGAGVYSYFANKNAIGATLLRSCPYSVLNTQGDAALEMRDAQDTGSQRRSFAVALYEGGPEALLRISDAFDRSFPILSVGVRSGTAPGEKSFCSCDSQSWISSLRRVSNQRLIARAIDASGSPHVCAVQIGRSRWEGQLPVFGIRTLHRTGGAMGIVASNDIL
jgi:alpha-mannosidase